MNATHPYTVATGTDRLIAVAPQGVVLGVGTTEPAFAPAATGFGPLHQPTP